MRHPQNYLANINNETGIVLPAIAWFLGVPGVLVIVLWALGVF